MPDPYRACAEELVARECRDLPPHNILNSPAIRDEYTRELESIIRRHLGDHDLSDFLEELTDAFNVDWDPNPETGLRPTPFSAIDAIQYAEFLAPAADREAVLREALEEITPPSYGDYGGPLTCMVAKYEDGSEKILGSEVHATARRALEKTSAKGEK